MTKQQLDDHLYRLMRDAFYLALGIVIGFLLASRGIVI